MGYYSLTHGGAKGEACGISDSVQQKNFFLGNIRLMQYEAPLMFK